MAATYTSYLNLKKPDPAVDNFDLANDFNANWQKIDDEVKKKSYTSSTGVATQAAFDTILDAALSASNSNEEIHLRITPSASYGVFISGEVYFIDMKKSASTTYSSAIISRVGSYHVIKATRDNNGWVYNVLAADTYKNFGAVDLLTQIAGMPTDSMMFFRTTSTTTNVPVDESYLIGMAWHYGANNINVMCWEMSIPHVIYTNSSTNGGSTWKGWKQASGDGGGISIPTGSDFDNYITPGVYYVANSTVAAGISNMPGAYSGRLEVKKSVADGSERYWQLFYVNGAGVNAVIYTRVYTGSWTLWKKITLDENAPYKKMEISNVTAFTINLASSSRWKIIVTNAGETRCAEFIAVCSSAGTVGILETKKGSGITLATGTNKVTVTGNTSGQTYSIMALIVAGGQSGISIEAV